MYYTLLGHTGFRKGMDLYFQRHDGQAVTCDDFRAAMADANGRDLTQFERWYSQAGTPCLKVMTKYDAEEEILELTFTQSCPATTGQNKKLPFHIPVAMGLLNAAGQDMPLYCMDQDNPTESNTLVLEVTKARQVFRFTKVTEQPTLSLLRNFSAPVELIIDYTDAELAHLLAHDSDAFNRWEAGQRWAMRCVVNLVKAVQTQQPLKLDLTFIEALRLILNDTSLDASFREQILTLPSTTNIGEQMRVIDPQAIKLARNYMRSEIAHHLRVELLSTYQNNLTPGKYSPDAISAGRRALKNCVLFYLQALPEANTFKLAYNQFKQSKNMTDRVGALNAVVNAELINGSASEAKEANKLMSKALKQFYNEFKDDALVIDKWFSLQATADNTNVAKILELLSHPAFTLHNPNRARSLIFAFCNNNPTQFHSIDGSGYSLWADCVISLNAMNPQVAARLSRSLDRWTKYTPALQKLMKAALQKVATSKNMSRDVLEIVNKALAA
jgi:aminopeptidase N